MSVILLAVEQVHVSQLAFFFTMMMLGWWITAISFRYGIHPGLILPTCFVMVTMGSYYLVHFIARAIVVGIKI